MANIIQRYILKNNIKNIDASNPNITLDFLEANPDLVYSDYDLIKNPNLLVVANKYKNNEYDKKNPFMVKMKKIIDHYDRRDFNFHLAQHIYINIDAYNKHKSYEEETIQFCIINKEKIETEKQVGRGIDTSISASIGCNTKLTSSLLKKLIELNIKFKYNQYFNLVLMTEEMINMCVEKNFNLNYSNLSAQATVSFNYILNNRFKNWNYDVISLNPNITEEIIEQYPQINWKHKIVSNIATYHPYVYKNKIIEYINKSQYIRSDVSKYINLYAEYDLLHMSRLWFPHNYYDKIHYI